MAQKKIRQVIIQRKHDLTGKRFGKLTVVKFHGSYVEGRRPGRYWECLCDCGKTSIVYGSNLKWGDSTSCGCMSSRHAIKDVNKSHGETAGWKHKLRARTTEYQTWMGMRRRCNDKAMENYERYGAKGITVCDRWMRGTEDLSAFECFLQDMGRKPSPELSLDRIDNSKGYFPENCRWATKEQQANNRDPSHNAIWLTYRGETQLLSYWAKKYGLRKETLRQRIRVFGWSVEKALTEPLQRS